MRYFWKKTVKIAAALGLNPRWLPTVGDAPRPRVLTPT